MKRLGFLGPEGTFSQEAAQAWLRRGGLAQPVEPRALTSIPEIMAGVVAGELDQGVVPLENSIEGTVNLTMDLLYRERSLQLCGEVVLEVHHYLWGRAESLGEVSVVCSHPQALAQCREFISRNLARASVQQASSTAEAARLAASGPPGLAAVSSRLAGELYGLRRLASCIEDFRGNKTRFGVIGKDRPAPSGRDKTSLVLAVPRNRPGGLYEVLGEFAAAGINLTRIESRPTKKELGEYLFFLDCQGHCQDQALAVVLQRLNQRTVLLEVLGSYPQAADAQGEAEGA